MYESLNKIPLQEFEIEGLGLLHQKLILGTGIKHLTFNMLRFYINLWLLKILLQTCQHYDLGVILFQNKAI